MLTITMTRPPPPSTGWVTDGTLLFPPHPCCRRSVTLIPCHLDREWPYNKVSRLLSTRDCTTIYLECGAEDPYHVLTSPYRDPYSGRELNKAERWIAMCIYPPHLQASIGSIRIHILIYTDPPYCHNYGTDLCLHDGGTDWIFTTFSTK